MNTPPASKQRHWFWRWLRWLLVVGFLGVLLLAGLGWWAWTHPSASIKFVLRCVPGAWHPMVDEVLVRDGVVTVKALSLRDPFGSNECLHVDELVWDPEVRQLLERKLGTMKLKGLRLDVSAGLAEDYHRALMQVAEAEDAAPSGGVQWDYLSIADASLRIAADGRRPSLEMQLKATLKGGDLRSVASPSLREFDLTVVRPRVGGVPLPDTRCRGELGDGVLRVRQLVCSDGRLAPALALAAMVNDLTSAPAPAELAPPVIKSIAFDEVKLLSFSLHGGDHQEALPDWCPRLRGRVDVSMNDVLIDEHNAITTGRVGVVMDQFEARPPTGAGGLTLAHGEVNVDRHGSGGALHVLGARFRSPKLDWTPDVESWLMPTPTQASAAGAVPTVADASSAVRSVRIDALEIEDGSLALKRTARVPFTGECAVGLSLDVLQWDVQGLHSAQAQTLRVSHLTVAEHPSDREQSLAPFTTMEGAELRIVPDQWNASRGIERLHLTKPFVRAHPDNVSWFRPAPQGSTLASSTESDRGVPLWQQIHSTDLAIKDGCVDLLWELPQQMAVRCDVNLHTTAGTAQQVITCSNVRQSLPQMNPTPILTGQQMEVALQWPQVMQTKVLDRVLVQGAAITVGDALRSLAPPPTASVVTSAEAGKPAQPPPLAGWRVTHLKIADTQLTLERVVPGLPEVRFVLNDEARDVPLSPAEMRGNFVSQQVELSHLAIHSPYKTNVPVVEMPRVLVQFSLDGLLRETIDRVVIARPTIYVGEDLFWYVDFYRRFAAGDTVPGESSVAIADASADAFKFATQVPVKTSAGWTLNELHVQDGEMFIAPKGHPLPGIPRPFPFSCITRLNSGQFEATFDIPSDTYEWDNPKVKLEGLRGHVIFNLPIKGVNNNLTQVFQVDRMRWKELHLENADLSVTYDANGVYGKFNAVGYEGYVNGGFDVYMDQQFSWDGWIAGTNIRSTEITQKLCPDYFLLDGKVNLALVAQGNQSEVYQCDVNFNHASPGRFSIHALNGMLNESSDDMPSYQRDVLRIGVETLRDFDYDYATGKLRMYGREGKGRLSIRGPAGERNFDVNILDHRATAKPPSAFSLQTLPAAPSKP